MVDVFFDAKFLEHQHTSNAEQIFLFDAVFPIAAVKGMGDIAVAFLVKHIVGVHEIELHATYVYTKDCNMNCTPWERYFNEDLVAVFVEFANDRNTVEVLGLVVCNLLSVHGEALCEVSIAIEQADAAHVNIAVAGFFHVVACQDTETTAIYLEAVVHTIFHTEVCYTGAALVGFYIHVFAEFAVGLVHASNDFRVFAGLLERIVVHAIEEFYRIAVYFTM